ncbi:MAG: hypothetical protein P8Y53_24915, partial [Pseudolabrys sp.]
MPHFGYPSSPARRNGGAQERISLSYPARQQSQSGRVPRSDAGAAGAAASARFSNPAGCAILAVAPNTREAEGRMAMARAMQVWRAGLALLLLAGSAVPALALTKQEAAARCRRSVGHPFVVSCIRGHHGSRASCKAQVKSRIRACVLKTLDAANKRKNVPVAMPEQQGPSKEVELRAAALPATYVAPPRTISDITAILDGEKPDAGKIAMRKAKADAEPPAHASHVQIARFYYGRAGARAKLGRLRDALDDSTKALQAAHGHVEASLLGRLEQQEGLLHLAAGDPKTALITLLHQARTSSLPGWRKSYARHGQSWEADVETTHAALSEARGQYAEALKAYRVAELRKRASIKQILAGRNPPPKGQIEQAADILVLGQSRMEARLGQFAQAEADARRALIARLKDQIQDLYGILFGVAVQVPVIPGTQVYQCCGIKRGGVQIVGET